MFSDNKFKQSIIRSYKTSLSQDSKYNNNQNKSTENGRKSPNTSNKITPNTSISPRVPNKATSKIGQPRVKLSSERVKLSTESKRSTSPIPKNTNWIELIIKTPVNSLSEIMKSVNMKSIIDRKNNQLVDKMQKLIYYYEDSSAINNENKLLKEKLTSVSEKVKEFKSIGRELEKLSNENNQLKHKLSSISENDQLKYVKEYENKSFKTTLELFKIHFKSFVGMFTNVIDHIVNRCIHSNDDETNYGIHELKVILQNKINYFTQNLSIDLSNELHTVNNWFKGKYVYNDDFSNYSAMPVRTDSKYDIKSDIETISLDEKSNKPSSFRTFDESRIPNMDTYLDSTNTFINKVNFIEDRKSADRSKFTNFVQSLKSNNSPKKNDNKTNKIKMSTSPDDKSKSLKYHTDYNKNNKFITKDLNSPVQLKKQSPNKPTLSLNRRNKSYENEYDSDFASRSSLDDPVNNRKTYVSYNRNNGLESQYNAFDSRSKSPMSGEQEVRNSITVKMMVVLYDYEKKHQKDLELRKDDIVTVLKVFKNGWCLGRRKCDNSTGLFPSNYAKYID